MAKEQEKPLRVFLNYEKSEEQKRKEKKERAIVPESECGHKQVKYRFIKGGEDKVECQICFVEWTLDEYQRIKEKMK